MDAGSTGRLERRMRELYEERMRDHGRRLDEWKRQQATRASLHTELADTVCVSCR